MWAEECVMATNKNRKTQNTQSTQRTRRTPQTPKPNPIAEALKRRKEKSFSEFKPDAKVSTWSKTMRMTRQQQLRLAKWALYILTIVMCLVIQDVIMSQISIFGATTDLAVCAILLIAVIEGTEVGSLFVLIASTLYYFSGTAPGAYCVGLLTFLGVIATMLRQMYWHRSKGSIILCCAIALTGYEMGLFVVGIFMELTIFSRLGSFLLTSLYSCLALIPLYSLIYKIGLIGGNTWKE